MERGERIDRIIAGRGPLVERIARATGDLNPLASQLTRLREVRADLLLRIADTPTAQRLRDLEIETLQKRMKQESEALARLAPRFSRSSLQVLVIGRPGQGKSLLQQSISGLSGREIPDGDASHCTGVVSVAHHDPTVTPHAEVWFYDEPSFLREVLAPYYAALELGPVPSTMKEFRQHELPSLSPAKAKTGPDAARYQHLTRYRTFADRYSSLLNAPSPCRIPLEQVREYVAQDDEQGNRIFHNYLAIRKVDIYCTFPHKDAGRIALIDMPGLGDTGVGDEQRLARVVGQDVDFVLFVNKPSAQRAIWADVDVTLNETARAALEEIPLEHWSFMVLNRLAPSIPGGNNALACERMKAGVSDVAGIRVNRCVTVDCSDPADVLEHLLDPALDYLALNVERLDARYTAACDDRLRALGRDVQFMLERANEALGSHSTFESEHLQFRQSFHDLWSNLTTGLEAMLQRLREGRQSPDPELAATAREVFDACRRDTGLPDATSVRELRDREGGYLSAFEKCLNHLRNQLVQKFSNLETPLQRTLDAGREAIADVLRNQGRMDAISPLQGNALLLHLQQRMPADLEQLRIAIQTLSSAELTYRGFLQYRIRQHLELLMTDMPRSTTVSSVETVRELLEIRYRQTLAALENAFAVWLCEPNQVVCAVAEEFVDRVLRAEGIEQEWEQFYLGTRTLVWRRDFESLQEQFGQRESWLHAVSECARASNLSSLCEIPKGRDLPVAA